MLKISFWTRLLKNFLIIIVVKDNKVESNSNDSRINKINKISTKFKNIKIVKGQNFCKN